MIFPFQKLFSAIGGFYKTFFVEETYKIEISHWGETKNRLFKSN